MSTQQKYYEAEYFLEMMKEDIEDRQKLEYNISAFLSAARSITFFLEKRFPTKSKFNDWYFGKEQKDKTGILEFFRKKRNCNIHEKPINPRAVISVNSNVSMALSVSSEVIVRKADGTIKDYEHSEPLVKSKVTPMQDNTEIKYKWFFSDCPNEYKNVDVINLCEGYLNKLKIIVEEVESKFDEANAP